MDQDEIHEFREELKKSGLGPVAVHMPYLPNFASKNQELYEKSVLTLGEDYQRANLLGADFLVVHPGKMAKDDRPAEALELVARAVRLVLEQVQGPTRLLLENQAGSGNEIASRFEELGEILRLVEMPERIGVCFDTCHGFAAGYELRTAFGWQQLTASVEATVGLEQIHLLHLNDARGEMGGHLDRHAHWGEGFIGEEGFRNLLRQEYWRDIPGVLETPQDTAGDDLRNLAFLRRIIREENGE